MNESDNRKEELLMLKKKKMLLIAVLAAMTVTLAGCGGNSSDTSDTSTQVQATEQETEKATTIEEVAADKAGLKVDEKGNVTDKNGKKVSVKDGKVTVEVDGKKINDDTEDIMPVSNKTSTTSKSISSSTASSKPASSDTSSKTTSASNTTSSKPTNSNTSSNTTSSKQETSKPTTSTPTESKTWHEAVYEYTEVWVVDKAAYTYEEPVYEEHGRAICNDCGADITDNLDHIGDELLAGGKGSYRVEWVEVQVGTKTVTVPEQGHYETKKKLVREAGYY